MNNDLLLNSVDVFQQSWKLIITILAFIAWGSLLIFTNLKKLTGQKYTDLELTALALGGWPIPALLLSATAVFLNKFFPPAIIIAASLMLITLSTGHAIRAIWKNASLNIIHLIFFTLVFIRLGFIVNIVLPPYFDSAEHYNIIQSLLSTNIIFPADTYYHIGYHTIIAAFTLITSQNIGQAMLVFGQIILAAIPLPIYFFVLRITDSHRSALFAVALASFGWFMPAHAVNWGKYPALLSLLLIQFTLGLAFIKNRRLFILSLITSFLIHSRSIILIPIILGAWMLSTMWMEQTRSKRNLLFGLVSTILGIGILLIKQNQWLGPIFEPYFIWVTLLIGLLSVLVIESFSQLIFFCLLVILSILFGMFIPVTSVITLLDRPLVEMTLFLPLAFLGGLGVTRIPKLGMLIVTVLIIIHALALYDFSPSACCQFVSRDDAAALDWMSKNLPADSYIAIASATLGLNQFGAPMQNTGTDAGIWVTPITQWNTLRLPYAINLSEFNTHSILCGMQLTHIYIGNQQKSFSNESFLEKSDWYEIALSLPKVKIVQINGCQV